jgi:hypothetical protein
LFATLVFKGKSRGWETFVETSDKLIELKPRVQEPDPRISYVDMVEMFRTGKRIPVAPKHFELCFGAESHGKIG